MRLPKVATITVLDSTATDKRHSIDIHLQILMRKLLNIFAKNPGEYGPVTDLRKEVIQYASVEQGLEDERLLTPALVNAVIKDIEVIVIYVYNTIY